MPAIFRISRDPQFDVLDPAELAEYERAKSDGSWSFTGRKFKGDWSPISLKRAGQGVAPDVWFFQNTFAMEDQAAAGLQLFAEQSGDIRMASVDGRRLTFVHVTYALNCLNAARTEWDRSVEPPRIKRYAFHHSRVDWSLFKIPETHQTEILTVQGLAGPREEFKSVYEAEGLTGLVFEELDAW